MKFTLSWLKDHLDTDAGLDEITDKLTMLGLELESVEDHAKALEAFVVGYVEEAKQHPNADRLKLCRVNTGDRTLEVVCGAPNARAGMKGVFAFEGTYIPGSDMTLKKSKIRGVESQGMLCSERELGLSDEHQGIIELSDDATVGAPAAEALGLGDPVIEIGLTPNRADCTGVRGIARDLAAAGLGALKPLDAPERDGDYDSPIQWQRDFAPETEDACPLVVGRYFRNVKNGPSPKWMQDRLRAIGLRPISALVDITNYVTFDLGRPLHVFDADSVAGNLVMRLAREGESIGALDGRTYDLDPDMTVIGDDDGPEAIAGVMGGEGSGCGDDTANVFLEVALFDPLRTAATGRKLQILSDARYRFERGVDPTSAFWGAHVATRLITEICGGEPSKLTVAGAMPDWERRQTLRKSRIAHLGGVHLPADEPSRILAALGFENEDDGELIHASVPPWRPDINGEADLVEEVLRIYGYDNIPAVPLASESVVPSPAIDTGQRRAGHVRRALSARGLVEAVTFSFMSRKMTEPFGGVPDDLVLANPISADLDAMRPSILPNLIEALSRNAARGTVGGALFELGPAYRDDTPDGQVLVAGGVRAGDSGPRHWLSKPRPADVYDAKADALAALAAAGAPVDSLRIATDAPGWYHPGRSGALTLGPNVLAWFGEAHPDVLDAFDLRGPAAMFEVFLDAVPPARARKSAARPLLALSAFHPVERDFAFVVDADTDAAAIVRAAAGADKTLVTDISVFDVYSGTELGTDKKSVAIAVTLQPTEATLTDAEIDAVGDKIVAAVQKATGGVLRG